jgi:hypothetical protein
LAGGAVQALGFFLTLRRAIRVRREEVPDHPALGELVGPVDDLFNAAPIPPMLSRITTAAPMAVRHPFMRRAD